MFEPFGKYVASLLPSSGINSVLEIACGTGRLTNHLRKQIPANASLIASDINPDMLDIAITKLKGTGIDFQIADASQLPFENNSFDFVVCQFGLMFLPDKQKGFNEVFRVLKPGGKFIFTTWDKTENIPVEKIIFNDILLPFFHDEDTSRFKVPFSLHDPVMLNEFFKNAGFKNYKTERIALTNNIGSAKRIVEAYLLKHSLGTEVVRKDPSALEPMAERMQHALEAQFGTGNIICELFAFTGIGKKINT